MLRRQCNTKIVALCLEQLLGLLALRGGLRPQILQRGRIATLTGLSRRLHLRLELLAKCLVLRLVLAVDVLDIGLLSVAERDSLEQHLLHRARAKATPAAVLPSTVLRLARPGHPGLGLGRLLSRRN